LLLLATLLAPVSRATTILFATGTTGVPGAVIDADGATVFSEAYITINPANHTVMIKLLNLQLDPADIKSVIGAVEVDFANLAAGTTTASMNQQALVTTFGIDSTGAIVNRLDGQSAQWKVETANSAPTA